MKTNLKRKQKAQPGVLLEPIGSGVLRLIRKRVRAITHCDHAVLKDDGYQHCPKCGDPI